MYRYIHLQRKTACVYYIPPSRRGSSVVQQGWLPLPALGAHARSHPAAWPCPRQPPAPDGGCVEVPQGSAEAVPGWDRWRPLPTAFCRLAEAGDSFHTAVAAAVETGWPRVAEGEVFRCGAPYCSARQWRGGDWRGGAGGRKPLCGLATALVGGCAGWGVVRYWCHRSAGWGGKRCGEPRRAAEGQAGE